MFSYCDALIDYVAENNRHVRDMVALARSVPAEYAGKPIASVNAWVKDFIRCNPNQAALFSKRGWL